MGLIHPEMHCVMKSPHLISKFDVFPIREREREGCERMIRANLEYY